MNARGPPPSGDGTDGQGTGRDTDGRDGTLGGDGEDRGIDGMDDGLDVLLTPILRLHRRGLRRGSPDAQAVLRLGDGGSELIQQGIVGLTVGTDLRGALDGEVLQVGRRARKKGLDGTTERGDAGLDEREPLGGGDGYLIALGVPALEDLGRTGDVERVTLQTREQGQQTEEGAVLRSKVDPLGVAVDKAVLDLDGAGDGIAIIKKVDSVEVSTEAAGGLLDAAAAHDGAVVAGAVGDDDLVGDLMFHGSISFYALIIPVFLRVQ